MTGASFGDLDPALIDRFRTPRGPDDREALARMLAIATPDETGGPVPTVAGVLLGAEEPERWLRHAYVQAVAYRGTSVSDSLDSLYYQIDARDVFGPLDATAGHVTLWRNVLWTSDKERFCHGHWGAMISDGQVRRLLERIEVVASETSDEQPLSSQEVRKLRTRADVDVAYRP